MDASVVVATVDVGFCVTCVYRLVLVKSFSHQTSDRYRFPRIFYLYVHKLLTMKILVSGICQIGIGKV